MRQEETDAKVMVARYKFNPFNNNDSMTHTHFAV